MTNIYKNVKVYDCGDDFFELELGIHQAQLEGHKDGTFSFFYEMGSSWCEWYYDVEEEGCIENALWEWFCSLSRLTNPNWERILGRKDLAESF